MGGDVMEIHVINAVFACLAIGASLFYAITRY